MAKNFVNKKDSEVLRIDAKFWFYFFPTGGKLILIERRTVFKMIKRFKEEVY